MRQLQAHGVDVPYVKGGDTYESATISCSHCSATVILNPLRTRPKDWCPKCDAYVCWRCEDTRVKTGECHSMRRILDELRNALERNTPLPLLHLPEGVVHG